GRPEISSNFGTLRYGKLLEVLLHDNRRSGTMHGPSAVFVEPEVEAWLKARMQDPLVSHVVNAPSLPLGWTKGNWYDWYPDLTDNGPASVATPKPYWQ
ncbi:MAG: alkaline phosphatase D family protein, partial [Alphaproteobacteria bacterium]